MRGRAKHKGELAEPIAIGSEGTMNTRRGENSRTQPLLLPATGLTPSLRRIGALIERYIFLLRGSGVKVIGADSTGHSCKWSLGLLQKHLAGTTTPLAHTAGVLIGSILLWDILFSSKIGFSTTFVEEISARNLGTLLTSPLRVYEFVAALSVWSVIRLGVSTVPVAFAAYFFFGFNLLGLGLALGLFFAVLVITSWSLGLISAGFTLRYGLAAEGLAWFLSFPPSCRFAAFFIQCRFCRRGSSR